MKPSAAFGSNPPPNNDEVSPGGTAANSETTGLPWFRTWGGVYLFVLGCFLADVVLLAVFTRLFSR
jgi:hypothetical protein